VLLLGDRIDLPQIDRSACLGAGGSQKQHDG
jgi:hypothetical protein